MKQTRQYRAFEAGCTGAPPAWRPAAIVTALACLPTLAIYAWPTLTHWLQFDRTRIADGEVWRVVTSHWTHFSAEHLLWDLTAFGLLLFLSWRESPPRTLATVVTSSVLIPVAVWVALPEMSFYRGLSGLASALFVFLALSLARRERAHGNRLISALAVLALVGFLAKSVFELVTGATLFVDTSEFVPVPLAHVIGAACGAIATGDTHVLDAARCHVRHIAGRLFHRGSGLQTTDRLDPAADRR